GLVATGILTAVEYGIAVFIQLFLREVGGEGFSMDVAGPLGAFKEVGRGVPAAYLFLFLALTGVVRGCAQFFVLQSGAVVREVTNLRLRAMMADKFLGRDEATFESAADLNLYVGECFPRTGQFFYVASLLL